MRAWFSLVVAPCLTRFIAGIFSLLALSRLPHIIREAPIAVRQGVGEDKQR